MQIKAGRPSSGKATLSIDDVKSEEKIVRTSIDIPESLRKEIKMHCAKTGDKMGEVWTPLMRAFLDSGLSLQDYLEKINSK